MNDLNKILDRKDIPEDVKSLIRSSIENQKQERRIAEKELELFLANVPAVIWRSDERGITTYISPNVEKVYGYTPDEIYQGGEKLWFGRIHPEDVNEVKQVFFI